MHARSISWLKWGFVCCRIPCHQYHHTLVFLRHYLLPVVVLVLLNGSILNAIYHPDKSNYDIKTVNKNSYALATKILLSIIVIFMICHAPCIVYKILWYFGCMDCTETEDSNFRKKWFFITPIKKLFLVTNSSINFIVYCIVGAKFRKELFSLIQPKVIS